MSLPPRTPAVSQWLQQAVRLLKDKGISTARLDAELILAHTLRKSRTYLHAHSADPIERRRLEIAEARLALRLDRTPVAYVIGHKEFYGRHFKVTPSTLIPRPESETIITLLKNFYPLAPGIKIVDVGTGSGCLGITAKLELPAANVTLIDISRHALVVAESNAKQLKADVTFIHSDLLTDYPFGADCIIANLPYVDKKWDRSPETTHEPAEALFASDSGLHLIKRLLLQTPPHLIATGLLLIEADPRQHHTIIEEAKVHRLAHLKTDGFVLVFQKVD